MSAYPLAQATDAYMTMPVGLPSLEQSTESTNLPVNTTLNSTPVTPLPGAVEQGPVDSETYHPSLATHAARNSDHVVQPVSKISKLSDAQKASNLLRRKVGQVEHQQLIEEFDVLLQRHLQELEVLATKFSVKPEYLNKLKGTSKHFKVKRRVNIENAKIHKKSIEMNEGNSIYILFLAYSHSQTKVVKLVIVYASTTFGSW